MLKEKVSVLRKLLILLDLSIVLIAFFCGFLMLHQTGKLHEFETYLWILPVFVLLWMAPLYFLGMYNSFRIKQLSDIAVIISKTAAMGFLIFGSLTYMFKIESISRVFIVFIFLKAAVSLMLEKTLLMMLFQAIRKKGFNTRNILIVGTGKRAQNFISVIEEHKEWGLRIFGLLDEDPEKVNRDINGYKVLGTFDSLPDIVHKNIIDEVAFVVPRSWLGKIEHSMQFCETEGVRMHVAVDLFELKLTKAKQTDLKGLPLLTFESTPDQIWLLFIKRFFDVMVSAAAILFLLPLFIVIGILIKLSSPGPVLFRQQRCGLNGRLFTLYKFRTMVPGAEEQLKDLLGHNEMKGPVFKMRKDPRITRIGQALRKLSFDELPQLWNVFKGDMSLIGPRPPLPTEVAKYDNWHRRALSMKPGLTCLWQVNGRNKITDFNDWKRLDLEYIDNWSLFLDLKIFMKTIPVVLFGIGAK